MAAIALASACGGCASAYKPGALAPASAGPSCTPMAAACSSSGRSLTQRVLRPASKAASCRSRRDAPSPPRHCRPHSRLQKPMAPCRSSSSSSSGAGAGTAVAAAADPDSVYALDKTRVSKCMQCVHGACDGERAACMRHVRRSGAGRCVVLVLVAGVAWRAAWVVLSKGGACVAWFAGRVAPAPIPPAHSLTQMWSAAACPLRPPPHPHTHTLATTPTPTHPAYPPAPVPRLTHRRSCQCLLSARSCCLSTPTVLNPSIATHLAQTTPANAHARSPPIPRADAG